MVNNNGKILNLRIEDLHIPRGVLFRNPFIKNDFFPQDTDNLFLFFYQATLGNLFSLVSKDQYPIAKMVHFMIAEENLTQS